MDSSRSLRRGRMASGVDAHPQNFEVLVKLSEGKGINALEPQCGVVVG
jgi:hypothetical protein